jgi:hypothetical protein
MMQSLAQCARCSARADQDSQPFTKLGGRAVTDPLHRFYVLAPLHPRNSHVTDHPAPRDTSGSSDFCLWLARQKGLRLSCGRENFASVFEVKAVLQSTVWTRAGTVLAVTPPNLAYTRLLV